VSALGAPPPAPLWTEGAIRAAMELLDYYITTGLEALQTLDAVLKSLFFILVQWTDVFGVAWLGYACVLMYGGTRGERCHPAGLLVLGLRVAIFLVALLPRLATLVTFFLSRLMPKRSFQVLMMAWAYRLDEFVHLGVPVAVVLVQALLIRDWEDMVSLQIRLYEMRKTDLKAKEKEAQRGLDRATADLKRNQSRIKYLRKVEGKARRKRNPSSPARQQLQRHKQDILQEAELVLTRLNGHITRLAEITETQIEQLRAGEKPDVLRALEERGQHLATQLEEHERHVQLLIAEGRLQEGMEEATEALLARADVAVEQGRAVLRRGREAAREHAPGAYEAARGLREQAAPLRQEALCTALSASASASAAAGRATAPGAGAQTPREGSSPEAS